MINSSIELFSDGSAIKNPGPASFAYIIRYYEENEMDGMPEPKEIEFSQGYRLSTNNRMEIMGILFGLKAILAKVNDGSFAGITQINAASDSEYAVNSITKGWITKWQQNNWMTSSFGGKKPNAVKNKDLWEQVIEVQDQLKQRNITLNLTWIKGHDGHEFNERCDKLAVAAANSNNFIIDTEYEASQTR